MWLNWITAFLFLEIMLKIDFVGGIIHNKNLLTIGSTYILIGILKLLLWTILIWYVKYKFKY